jgi:hypothetical protein
LRKREICLQAETYKKDFFECLKHLFFAKKIKNGRPLVATHPPYESKKDNSGAGLLAWFFIFAFPISVSLSVAMR